MVKAVRGRRLAVKDLLLRLGHIAASLATSRVVRVSVARRNNPYSLVSRPLPALRRKGNRLLDRCRSDRRVLPTSIKHEPSAVEM